MSKDNLKEERIRVLDMLSKKIIDAEEAEKLLNALEGEKASIVEKKAPFRMLKILVDSKDGDNVKIQIPIEFAKMLKSNKFNLDLDDKDIDLDAVIEMINNGHVGEIVNIDSKDGDKVKIIVE